MPYISMLRLDRMTRQQFLEIIRMMKKLTTQDIDLFVAELNSEILNYVESIPAEARIESMNSSRGPIPINIRDACASFFAQYYQDSFFNGEETATEIYFKDVLATKFDISGMERELVTAAHKYSVLLHQSQLAQLAFLKTDMREYYSILTSLKQCISMPVRPVTSEPEQPKSNNHMTLSEAWSGFLKFKSTWTVAIRSGNQKYYEAIEAILGADKKVRLITRRDIKSLLEVIEGLPRKNMKPYNKMTIQQCLDLDDIPEEHLVSSKTVRDYLKLCQGLFSTYLTKELEVFSESPTHGITREAKSQSYGHYSDTEMRKFVEHFLTLDGWNKWVFLLLAYTGARRSEIVKLKFSDVLFDDDSERYYIMIRDSKTEAGIRQVPISSFLIDNGFMDYVNSRKQDATLFPEITNKTQVTHNFSSIRDKLGISHNDDFKKRRVVHSLRHTFVTKVQTKGHSLTLIQQTIGHEHSNQGQTKVYTGKMKVSDLLAVIDSVNWHQ